MLDALARNVPPTPLACLSLLQSCASFVHFLQIHCQILRHHLAADPFIASKLLEFSAASPHGSLAYARKLFDCIPQPNVFSWNTLIRGHASSPNPSAALRIFHSMLFAGIAPNSYTFPFALKACARLLALREGKQLHGFMCKSGADMDVFSVNGLISMYCACRQVELGQQVFDSSLVRDVASWTSMLSGYVECQLLERAWSFFCEMPERGVVSWNAMINGYVKFGDVEAARKLFEMMPERNAESWNTLIAGFAKCGHLDMASKLFEEMPCRNGVTWSAMISAYAQWGQPSDALVLFEEMKCQGVWPNYAAIVSVLSACSQLGALDRGKKVHSYIERNKMKMDSVIGTALIDMYSKCGSIDKALETFSSLVQKDVFSWSAIIGGLAVNGHGAKALEFFRLMEEDGVWPNEVTFLGVLCACSHAGLVDLAKHFFHSMSTIYRIQPQIEHCGCMVDVLSRAGHLHEAVALVESIPGKGNPELWVTLLGASWIHGDIKIAEAAVHRLMEIKPDDGGVYVILSNIYAMKGMWDKAKESRMLMKSKGLKKEPSRCLIEIHGVVHEFYVGDLSHPETSQIYKKLNEIFIRIRLAGYGSNTRPVLFDIEEEEKEHVVAHHSEKLAVAYGLICMGEKEIRVFKNIRICRDCHTFMKQVSKVYERKIILRDRNVFHYFNEGSCSCGDYW
ncbi:hypothetical protein HPP92_027780 [Vanilla planifolia]|uniref:DYW domain-containing protein n=1 Tax=Vanilla planifolia TaxID=51239 RepID=A0A835U735_VANPL|nr:hypothetical protein HPP92_027780 [Vanilla planifolia]